MKSFKILLCTVLLTLLLTGVTIPALAYTGGSSTVYTMYINDEQVGIVKFPARALSIYDDIERRQRGEYQEEVFIDSKIYFKETNVGADEITDDDELANSIEELIDIRVDAYSIDIDGTRVCYVKTMEDAQEVIDNIKAPYIEKIKEKEDSQLEDVAFKQDIDFQEGITSVKNILSPEKAAEAILHGGQEIKEYRVQEGDSLWSIAQQNHVSVSDLELANPDLDGDIIQPEDIIMIGQQKKLLTTVTKEKVRYSKEIPFETETKEDNGLEKGKTKVVQQGENGKKDIVALVTREDGQEVSRDIIEEKVEKEPVKHIIAKGTKEKPKPAPRPKPVRRPATNSKSTSKPKSSGNTTTDRGTVSGSASSVVDFAMKYKGYKYVFGTSGPNTFDCSGFTKYVYSQFGVSLPHSSKSQRSVGSGVSKENLKPGDILCFSGHVGLYIGGNQFIHASNKKDGVKISNLSSYNKRLITARRIFK